MAERGGTRIPWTSLAVLVTFVSSTLLAPKAFDLLRPAEKERAQAFSGADLEVDARLWEDPFVAVRRHEADRVERCKNPSAAKWRECDDTQRTLRRSPQALRDHLDLDGDGAIDVKSTLLIAVLVPGNPFVGAEESRRRTRFALLAGLQAEGYYPDNAEQIGLMQMALPPATSSPAQRASGVPVAPATAASAIQGDQVQIPYELLSRSRNLRGIEDNAADAGDRPREPYQRVAVVWVDESALPGPRLDGVARVLDTVVACRTERCPRLAVLGPSSSEGLNIALHGLEAALNRRISVPAENIDESLKNGYRLLAGASIYSPWATISEEDLPLLRSYDMSLQQFLTAYFTGIVPERARLSAVEREVKFVRTVGPDRAVAKLLASEVALRLPSHSPRRIVTIVESDSIYARGLEQSFRQLAAKHSKVSRIDQAYFFRGIDGVTVRDGAERQTPAAAAAAAKPSTTTTVEWPESRDQLDYLRRMANELKRSESAQGGGPIGAIGVFANDVHDKLLVLQALHDTFPDKVFFTTDMDARYLHPRALPFTRNLVVASSLPLLFPPRLTQAADGTLEPASRQVQEGTPPMRDMYQTATYLAARLAACRRRCDMVNEAMSAAIAAPTIYEIGRNRAVAIDGFDAVAERQQHPGERSSEALAVAMGLMLVGLLVWPSTPSLRRACRQWLHWPTPVQSNPGRVSRMTWLFTALYGVWLGFAAASLVEATAPGSLGLFGALCWALLGLLAATLLSPGLRMLVGTARTARQALVMQVISLLLLAGLIVTAALSRSGTTPGEGEPLLWLEGISGWPSHFLQWLAVLAALVSLDVYWHRAGELKRSDAMWLGWSALPMASRRASTGQPWMFAVRGWLGQHTLLAWQPRPPGSVDFSDAWQHYQHLSGPLPRLLRVSFWYLVTIGAASGLFLVLTDHYIPEVPVRGLEHRALVVTGLAVALLALPALVVAVADATMLTCRLMQVLGRGRTLYPPDMVARFARELGADREALLREALAADPAQRDGSEPLKAHSLLDDWIDVQLVARETEVVSPLIFAPFVVLGLLVMARSRLFDNWAMTWPIALTAAAYVMWLVVLAVALKISAERLRGDALARMQADLRWLAGAGQGREKLVDVFKQLIAAVENNTTGAFAATFDQPLVTSLLVPLGGAGGVQLLDYLLLAR